MLKCNPSQIEAGKAGSLDFGDLSEGLTKSLPLKLLNRTRATVPIRLVISAVSTPALLTGLPQTSPM